VKCFERCFIDIQLELVLAARPQEKRETYVAVRLRMKRMGRRHRPFYRVCAVDRRGSRDGRVIEYLGHYDPMVSETDARAALKRERIDYWLSVGAQPSEKVKVLIKKYGTNGTHLEEQAAALERVKLSKPTAPPPEPVKAPPEPKPAPAAETETSSEGSAAEASAPPAEDKEPAPAAEAEAASEDSSAKTPAADGEPSENKE
jgi:small subunit ribosomal protein S16